MKTIVCSHGFGVRADDRGLFTDIAAAMPEYRFITFDYNIVEDSGNLIVRPLQEQVKILNEHISTESAKVTLLCHSQGCIIASLADLENIDTIIFLAPPTTDSIKHFLGRMLSRKGAVYDPDGVSSLPRSDGTMTYMSGGYAQSIRAVNIEEKYTNLAAKHNLIIIKAKEDEVLGKTAFDFLDVPILELDGGHEFAQPHRSELVAELQKLL